MSIAFKKMTRSIAWIMTASLAVAFMLPSDAAAVEFFSTPFRYQWKSQSGTNEGTAHVVRANAGDTVAMNLTITNRSIDSRAKVIYGTSALTPEVSPYRGAHELRLGTSNPHDKIYDWVDSSSFISNPDGASNRLAAYDGAAVNPGQDLTFNFNLKIKSGTPNGTYDFYVGVVREYDAWAKQVDSKGRLLPGEDIFWRVVVGGGSTTPATGGLTIGLASGTPAAGSVAKQGNANFTKMTLTAAAGATVKISSIYVTRTGMTADSDLENVKILKADGMQVGGTGGGFNANHKAQIFFTPALEITGSQDFYIRAGFSSTVTTGLTAQLGISENADVVSNATSVSGAPFFGNYMTAVAVTIGSVTVSEDGSIVDTTPDVGDTDVLTNTFKITAGSTEDILIDRITVMKSGSSETADSKNIELWDVTNNKTLGTVESWSADGKASWPVNITLTKGGNIRLRVQLDVVDGVGLTVNTDIADGSDYLVFAKGLSYGFYITPVAAAAANWTVDSGTGGTNNLGQGDKNQTINSGALTISKSSTTPATGNIAVADNQLLSVFDFDVRGESVRISATTVYGNLADAGGSTTITYADMTNARLVDMATGNILAGPVDGADCLGTYGTTAVDPKFVFSSTYVLPVGVTKVGFKTRLGTDWENSDTIVVAINAASDVTAKGIITNNSVTPGGSYAVAGNTLTVKSGALVVRDLGTPPSGSVVVGTQDFTWATMALDATASGEDVLVSSITVGDDVGGTSGNMADIDNAELWADLDNNGSYETKISNTETPDGAEGTDNDQAFTLTQTLRVPKGGTIKVVFVGDLAASGADADGTHKLGVVNDTVTTAGVVATGADTGTAITETDSGAGGTMTVAAAGTLTVGLDGSSPSNGIVLAGTSDNTVAKFKFTALKEGINVTKLTFLLTDWGTSLDQWDSIESLKIEYPKKDGTTGTRSMTPSTTSALFDNLDMYVTKNASAVVTVKASFYNIGIQSADFGDQIEIGVDADNTGFLASGESSGGSVTDCGDDTTANTQLLYKTLVTVTADNSGLGSTLVPGSTATLYQFKISADSKGSAGLKRLTFAVNLADNGTTSANADLTNFTIVKDSVDITASGAAITGLSGNAANTPEAARATLEATNYIESDADGQVTTWVSVHFGGTPTADTQETVSAGFTTTWQFRAQLGAGFSASDDDSVTTELLGDTTKADDGSFYLHDADVTADEYAVVLQTEGGVADFSDVEFVWSDNSGYDVTDGIMVHNASFTNNSTTETSSGDWANGAFIKNFPLGTRSIIA